MRARTVRAVLAAVVLAGGGGGLVAWGTLDALADTGVITPPADVHYFFPASLQSLGDLVVDGVHKRLIASDPTSGVIASASYTGYNGSNGATVKNLPGVAGLALSANSATLYAAVPASHVIIGYSTTTYAETARFTLSDNIYPRDVVVDGGRLWFSYDDNAAKGNFGSIDPATSTVTVHSFTGISPYYGAPLIAANPSAPGKIVLSESSAHTPGSVVAVYDVSTGTEHEIVEKSIDGLSYLRALELSADGSQVVVAATGGIRQLSSTDLSTVGTYLDTAGFAADVAPDGRVAVATRTDIGTPDLYTYSAGSTTALQAFDMPGSTLVNHPGPDQIMENGVVWQPDGPRLFVVTANNGSIGFRALDEPAATAITLTAPATATRAAALTIKGTITGNVPAGSTLTVTRSDLETDQLKLPDATTDASGTFAITDTPTAGGTVNYYVSYAGDDTHLASMSWASIEVSRATPALTVNRNGTVNAYGATVAMTAHLGTTYKNRAVEIWADPAGTDQANKLLKKSNVDSAGNLTVSLRLTRDTVVTAVFRGDPRYALRTVTSTLHTRVSVSTSVTKQYKTSGGYYYFRKTVNPVFTTTMTPYAKRKQKLFLDYYSGGAWHAWKSSLLTLTSAGKSTYTLTGAHSVGVKYRVRAAYLTGTSGDSLNYTTYGAYHYFLFTK